MRPAVLTLAFALSSLTPLAAAEAPMDMTNSMQNVISITIRMKHERHADTPSWIGDYNNRWFRLQTTTDKSMVKSMIETPTCAEAEGNPLKLLGLQRSGACPVEKFSTRIR